MLKKTDKSYTDHSVLLLAKRGCRRCYNYFIKSVVGIFCLTHIAPALAETNILFVSSNQNSVYSNFVAQVQSHLQKHSLDIIRSRLITADQYLETIQSAPKIDIIISIGSAASMHISHREKYHPTIFTLLTKNIYNQLEQAIQLPKNKYSAIYLDQPVKRQLDVITTAMPELRSLAVIYSAENSAYIEELQKEAQARNIKLNSRLLDAQSNLVYELNNLLDDSNALLGVPDSVIYQPSNAHRIILNSYRHNKPFIAYSNAYVNSGASLATYSTPDQIARQTAEMVLEYMRTGRKKLPAVQAPEYFSISYNRFVSNSLGLHLEGNTTLQSMQNPGKDEN